MNLSEVTVRSASDLDQHKNIEKKTCFEDREHLAIFLLSRLKAMVSTPSLRAQVFRVIPEPILKPIIRLGILRIARVTWDHADKVRAGISGQIF